MSSEMKVDLKPLSINVAWCGQRFPTDDYKQFKRDLKTLLLTVPKPDIPTDNVEYEMHFLWGFSNYRASDYDNPIKTAQDIIAAWLGIDDRSFACGCQRKVKVKKGDEFIKFRIDVYDETRWVYGRGLL